MAALVVLEGESPRVLAPDGRGHIIRVREEGVVDIEPAAAVEEKQDRLIEIEHVAGLSVFELRILGLPLVDGR
jgi:hypothetical protein